MEKSKYSHFSREQLEAKLEKLERERYGLVWEDKEENVAKQCETELPVLIEDVTREIVCDPEKPYNFIIEGDNYHSLYTLNFTHKKKIDVIYIDPPYNTGNQDFVYNDRFVDRTDKFRHSKWLSFMSKRLKLAKRLMSKRGMIFISIDDTEFAQLKLLCDKVFGENNFIVDAIWNSRKSVSNDTIISLNHNHTLVYAREIDVLQKNKTKYRLKATKSKFSNPDNDPRGKWIADPFDAPNIRPNLTYPIINPNNGKTYMPPKGRCWRTSESEYERLLGEGRIVFGKTGKSKPQLKRYFSDAEIKGIVPKSIWDDVGTTTNGTQELEKIFGEKIFNNPKPVSLLTRILEISSFKNSIILDFFAGSGTTAHAVLELNKEDGGNRQFILCTNNENNICEKVTFPRIKKVIEGYADKGGIPANVKYFKQSFVPNVTSDKDKRELVNRSTELLCMAENTFEMCVKRNSKSDFAIFKNATKQTAIIYDEESIKKCVKKLNEKQEELDTVIYVFSYDHTYEADDFENLNIIFTVKPIPEAILNIYRKISKMYKK